MLEQYVEQIFKELSPLLPKEWSRIVLFGLVLDSSYEISFYVKGLNSTEYKNAFSLQKEYFFTVEERRNVFRNIYDICCEAKDHMEGEKWKNFTLVVEQNGHFTIDYEYGEEAELIVSKWDEWKEKYLI